MAAEEGSPPQKRIKVEVFERFRNELKMMKALEKAFHNICFEKENPLVALEITSCNAAAGYGVPFSSASCLTLVPPYDEELFPFGSIFVVQHGITLLKMFLDDPDYVPDDNVSFAMLTKLLNFILDTSAHENLRKLMSPDFEDETTVGVMVARHLLSKLSVSSSYTYGHHCKRQEYCACGTCTENIRGYFGDTSIGHEQCWHGSLDIVFGSDLFAIVVKPKHSDEDSPGGRVPEEVKVKTFDDIDSRSRILAQLITFSFLQRKNHLESMRSFLVPCIAITREEIKVFFYDSEHDILFEGREHNILGVRGEINLEAVVIIWLVMNYKMTCSGLTSSLLKAPKSGFFQHAAKKISVYRNDLRFRGVRKGTTYKPVNYRYLAKSDAKFVWPPEYEKPF